MKIIHPNNDGITVLYPAACGLTVEEIALKDVPAGLPFLIVEDEEIPTDREFRAAWEADFSTPDGYGIGYDALIASKVVVAEDAQIVEEAN